MSVIAPADKINAKELPKAPTGAERRRRKRAKISAQLRARPAHSPQLFEDVCKTVDVSRDGLLFAATRKGYAKGQRLEITFPYTKSADEFNQPQVAEVVRVDAQPDGGVQVAVEFLAAREQTQAAKKGLSVVSSAAAQWMQPKDRPVVLAIEPDTKLAEVMVGALQSDGYEVVIVESTREALRMMRQMVPAVVIAEESQDISGHDLCVMIKRDDRLQAVPVILLTRAAQPADYSSSHSLGAVVCMSKPFKAERLQHVVQLVAPPAVRTAYSSHFGSIGVSRQF